MKSTLAYFQTLPLKDGNGKPYRAFAKDEGFAKNRATYDVNNLYRYEALFRDEPDAALAHFADSPDLNGGLFECLDRTEDGTDKMRYLDGFSRNVKKRPHVPDRLFFDSGETADLSVVRSKLDDLFAYTEKAHAFTASEVATLVAAIDALKILDPACGSGAFPRLPLAKADAGASAGARFWRANGPAPYQPRATPWVTCRQDRLSPEGATQPARRRPMSRPYRASGHGFLKPRAMPWAGMARTVGAEEAERDLLFRGRMFPRHTRPGPTRRAPARLISIIHRNHYEIHLRTTRQDD